MQPLIGGDGFATPLLVEQGGAASEGVVFSTHVYLGEGSSNAARSFADAYRQAYGTSPPNAFAALGYDALGLVADAIARAGSADPDAVKAALAATRDFAGITGTISFRSGRRVPDKTVTMLQVHQGKLVRVAEIVPAYVPSP